MQCDDGGLGKQSITKAWSTFFQEVEHISFSSFFPFSYSALAVFLPVEEEEDSSTTKHIWVDLKPGSLSLGGL